MIEVCYFRTDYIEPLKAETEIVKLPHNLQKHILSFHRQKDRIVRLGGYLILKCFLEREGFGITLDNIERDKNNKPYIPNWRFFNTSYAEDYAIIAFHDKPIGIDIEKITRIDDYKAISNYFHEEEKEKIFSSSNPISEFYSIWVKKEASLKAMGIGIMNGMNQFSCINDCFVFNNSVWHFTLILNQYNYLSYLCSNAKAEVGIKSYQELINLV